jgi:hypothetical protein
MLQVPLTVTVKLFAIVTGPKVPPLVLAGIVMFSLIVFALVLIMELRPKLGPPSLAPIAL